MSKVMTPVYKLKKKNKQIFVQNGIKTLAQENLFILKRLLEQKGNIDNQKLKKDFQKSQEYKHNICNFPTINSNRIKRVNEKVNQNLHYSSNNKTLPAIVNSNNNKLNKRYYKEVLLKKNTNLIKKTKKIEKEKKLEKKDIMSDNGSGSRSGDSENEGSVIG